MRVPVAEALPLVAEALPSGCGGSARFLQKQSQLLVLGLRLEFNKKQIWVKKEGLQFDFDSDSKNQKLLISSNSVNATIDWLIVQSSPGR